MRVLHLLKTGTGATWALRQTRELVKLGIEVHIAMPSGPLVPRYEAAGIVVHQLQFALPVRRPRRWPALFSAFRDLVARVRPQLIHSHFVGTTLTMRLALGRWHPLPRLFQVPGPLHLEHVPFLKAEIRSAGPADAWIGSCQWTCDRYRQCGIAPARIFRAYYGSDLSDFANNEPGRLRQELGVDAATPLVGMVAYMYPPKRYLGQTRGVKGHEDLIDALAIARARGEEMVGVIVGGAWDGAVSYEARIRRYGTAKLGAAIRFLGNRNDVHRLYPDFDIAVHPSHSENLGGAAESLLHGVPTIATNVGGFPDLVIPRETGWLVPPSSPDLLADAILDAIADPTRARRFALAGQTRARQWLDVRENAREILGIYEQVLQ
jgi:glycosyltransferase involved in cell wall biosynthesis